MRERNHYEKLLLYFLILLACCWLIPQSALAANVVVGKTLSMTGSVSIQREGKTWQLQVGEFIHLHDRLQTGIESRVEILCMDQSRIRMAPNTTLEITEYLYQPEKKKRKSLLSLWAGKARFIVNDLVDYTQKDFEVRTQAGIAGTRGTDFIMELKKRKSKKIGAVGKHRFDLQQKIEKFVKQDKLSSWPVKAQFIANGPVNFSHVGLLVYAAGKDISQERPNSSATMQLAQEDDETEGVVTVIEGEVFVCPKDEEGNIILELCESVIAGESVSYGINSMEEREMTDEDLVGVEEPGPPPEEAPLGDLPTPDLPPSELPPDAPPFETPAPEPASRAETG
jgi:hypothetical protein